MRRPQLTIRLSIALAALAAATVGPVPRAAAVTMDATSECLFAFGEVDDTLANGGTLSCTDCDAACDADSPGQANGTCTFNLSGCLNQAAGSCSAAVLKASKVNPKKARLTPAEPCGAVTGVVVKLKKKGKKAGKLKLKGIAKSTDKRVDKDVLTLICNPLAAGTACGTTTTTSTTIPGNATCDSIVAGQPILNTYKLTSIAGGSLCRTSSPNAFGPCTTDADCGGALSSCLQTPWVTVGGIPQPLPLGGTTVFTVTSQGLPTDATPCEHAVCIGCGNPSAPCPGIPGCVGDPLCVRTTCCDEPRLVIPTIFIAALNTCVRVDQAACGVGVINTSNPQVGDNEVNRVGDTSDPGPDCEEGTGDDPPELACTKAGEASDNKGKIVRTVGDGFFDANGIQYRFITPLLSTAWMGEPGCSPTSTYDGAAAGESIVSQLVLQAEPTTAGASASFADLDGDGCLKFGPGLPGDGPISVGPPAVAPMPYGGGQSVSVAVGIAFSGFNAPIQDIGFIAITPNASPTVEAPEACTCSPTSSCPE